VEPGKGTNRPTLRGAPPVYRPASVQSVMAKQGAPPAYRPQPIPAPLQAKQLIGSGAPAVYRIEVRKVLAQPATTSAPPVYRPQALASQPKLNALASSSPQLPAPLAYRPQSRATQPGRNSNVSSRGLLATLPTAVQRMELDRRPQVYAGKHMHGLSNLEAGLSELRSGMAFEGLGRVSFDKEDLVVGQVMMSRGDTRHEGSSTESVPRDLMGDFCVLLSGSRVVFDSFQVKPSPSMNLVVDPKKVGSYAAWRGAKAVKRAGRGLQELYRQPSDDELASAVVGGIGGKLISRQNGNIAVDMAKMRKVYLSWHGEERWNQLKPKLIQAIKTAVSGNIWGDKTAVLTRVFLIESSSSAPVPLYERAEASASTPSASPEDTGSFPGTL
jgi:hypothetical protein